MLLENDIYGRGNLINIKKLSRNVAKYCPNLVSTSIQVLHLRIRIFSIPNGSAKMNKKLLTASLLLSLSLFVHPPAVNAQGNGAPQVSVVNLQVVPGPNGQEVVTPKGDLAPLPGAGVNGGVVQIYVGAQGGFWYVDKTGQTIDLTPGVQALQARRAAQARSASQVPQYAPQYQESQQQNSNSSGGGGGSAVATAAAAAGGAMLGSAMTNSMYHYGVPYGTPMYYGAGGYPYYYGANGETRELNENQKVAIYNQQVVKNENQQRAMAQADANQQTRQENMSQNQAARQQAYTSANAQPNYQKQQDWYQQQLQQNPQKWNKDTPNPFVAQNAQGEGGRHGRRNSQEAQGQAEGGRFAGRGGDGDGQGDGGGRSARRGGGDASGDEGGRLGRRGGGDAQGDGGRFGGGRTQGDGGGRFGNREGAGGGFAGGAGGRAGRGGGRGRR